MIAQYAFTIEQGIRFTKSFKWTTLADPTQPKGARVPVNMTGMTATAPIRTRDGALIAEFQCAVNGLAGEVVLTMSDAQTAMLDFDTAIGDIDIFQAGVRVKRLLRTIITLGRDVPDEGVVNG